MRMSLENTYRSDSESDIDATDFLDRDPLNHQSQPAVQAYGPSIELARLRRSFARRSKCFFAILIILIIFWTVVAGGGFFLYKVAPVDGMSPPWYPTPPGGTS